MKKIYLYIIIPMLAIFACQDELYDKTAEATTSNQGLYLEKDGAIQQFVQENKDVMIDDIKINLVNKAKEDVNVNVAIGDQAQLDEYNKKNNTSYVLLPASMYEVKDKVTIKANYASVKVPIKLKNLKFSLSGTYALPLKLIGGDAKVIDQENQAIIILEQEIVTKSLKINGYGTEDAHMFGDDFSVDQWTMEVMVNRSGYYSNNKAIAGTKVVKNAPILDEIFTRFGDVVIDPNQLQIKTGASQIEIPKDKLAAKPNTWYMLTFVYDGKITKVYVNGELAASKEIRTGKYGMTGVWLSGSNEFIREFRFWNVARTDSEIKNNVWKMVNPDSKGLLLYYPMNGKKYDRQKGEIVEDETKIWDWSKNQKNLPMPKEASYKNDEKGLPFIFPPRK